MNKIYVMSDPHYGHKNICEKLSSWTNKAGTRNFDTVEQMNNAIVESINNIVGYDDILVCVGDWSFGGIENIYTFWSRLVLF